MKFLNVRDLRGKSASVWRSLPAEREMIITNNGRPVALLTAVDETNVEASLTAWRQVRATQALTAIQQQSMQKGTDSFSMDEIDAEIAQSHSTQPLANALPDQGDHSFLEVAISAKVDYLVTGNLKHFPPDLRYNITVLAPREFLDIVKKK